MNSVSILEHLVAFDTVSSKTNLPMLDWIDEYLENHGVKAYRVPDESGAKASLYAQIGPQDKSGYVLSGHTDVVPVTGQDWSSDPFKLAARQDKVYARGTCDMKGFLACVLAAVPDMIAADLDTPLVLAFSYDEEVGCTGVRPMLAQMKDWNVLPKGCFVGEPTSMSVVVGHKEKLSKRVKVTGLTGHSSLAPQAVNALEYAARLVTTISDIGRRLAEQGPRDELYDLPHTTAHVGRMVAGTQLNIVPGEAVFDFEFRAVAGDDPFKLLEEVEQAADQLLVEMQSVHPGAAIDFLPYSEIAGLDTAVDSDIAVLAKRLAMKNSHAKVAFSTEAGLFDQIAGVPTVVVGPGSIEQAHKADEYVELGQLASCDKFIAALIHHCSA